MRNLLMLLRLHVVAAALYLFATPALAQPGLTTEGREFWIGFMPNYITPADALHLYISSTTSNEVTVEQFDSKGSVAKTTRVSLGPGHSNQVKLPSTAATLEPEKPTYASVRVTSTAPCTVVGYSEDALSIGSYLALPIHALGTEYYCMSYYDDAYSPGADRLAGEFLIIAPYDGTQVTITTSANTSAQSDGKTIGHAKGSTWTVNLKRGQTYLVQSTGWEWGVGDLTGSHVTSSKPIGFISGHQRAGIELHTGATKDHFLEMLPAVEDWGTEYVGVPYAARPVAGNYYRILSAENDNVIRTSAKDTAYTLDAGEFIALSNVLDPIRFYSENGKKFIVAEYAYNGDYPLEMSGEGDPTMLILTPTSNFVYNGLSRSPSGGFRHYASIVSTSEGIDQLSIAKGNTSPVSASAFGLIKRVIPNTEFAVGTVRLSGDEVSWRWASTSPFALTHYGTSDAAGYGMSGPRSFSNTSDTITPTYKLLAHDSCGNYSFELRDTKGIADIYPIEVKDTQVFQTKWFTENYTFTIDSTFEVGDTVTRIFLHVTDLSKDATLGIYVVDQGGNDTIITGRFQAKPFTIRLDRAIEITQLGNNYCANAVIRNVHSDTVVVAVGDLPLGSTFRINVEDEYVIAPGDSVVFPVCFFPRDTVLYQDSLIVTDGCLRTGVLLSGLGTLAKLYAEDLYFGLVRKGDSKAGQVKLTNRGIVPISVFNYELLAPEFKVVNATFPMPLQPGESRSVTVEFTPTEDSSDITARINWELLNPTTLYKLYSELTGFSRPQASVKSMSEQLSIWPNPVSDHLWIELPEDERLQRVVAVDALGGEHTLSSDGTGVDLDRLPSGAYVLRIMTTTGQYQKQLVIKR